MLIRDRVICKYKEMGSKISRGRAQYTGLSVCLGSLVCSPCWAPDKVANACVRNQRGLVAMKSGLGEGAALSPSPH